jgi:hypothetical protein
MSPRDITSRRFGQTILSKLVQKSGSDINKQHAAARHDIIGQNARWIIILDDMIVEMASRRHAKQVGCAYATAGGRVTSSAPLSKVERVFNPKVWMGSSAINKSPIYCGRMPSSDRRTEHQRLFLSFAPAVKSKMSNCDSQNLANIGWAYAVAYLRCCSFAIQLRFYKCLSSKGE